MLLHAVFLILEQAQPINKYWHTICAVQDAQCHAEESP